MKHTLIPLASMLALGSTAFAGSTESVVQSNSQMTSSPLYKWFAGVSAGYFTDSEEEYYTLHFGAKIAESGPVSHSLFLEGAYADFDSTFVDVDLVPVTLNYKLDYHLTERFSAYVGVGAGAAFIDAGSPFGSDDGVGFAAQAFAGIGYDISPAFQIYGGARWLWVDDTEIGGVNVEVGDDVGLELGARFRF